MKYLHELDMSELEREIELEMGEEGETGGEEGESSEDFAFESEEDLEREFEALDDQEAEAFADFEGEAEDVEGEATDDYAQRFYELSNREFENESDLDREIGAILGEVERDYFWKSIKKGLSAGAKFGAKRLMQKAKSMAKGMPAFKALQGVTQLARGNVKGFLGTLAKTGLGAALRAHPAGSAALMALKGIGFNPLGDAEANREGWNNYVAVAREAYEHLASNLNENADNPLEASRQASNAFQAAVSNVQSKVRSGKGGGGGRRGKGKVLRIRVPKGRTVRIVIEGV